jgi:hypothetical protein
MVNNGINIMQIEYINIVTYVDVGYGDQTPCPPQRCELSEVMGWYKTCLKLSDSLI